MIFENPYFFQMVTSRTSRALSLESSIIPIRVVRARRSRPKMSTVNWFLLCRIERWMLYDFPQPENAAKKNYKVMSISKEFVLFLSCSHDCHLPKKDLKKNYNFMSNLSIFVLFLHRFFTVGLR